MHAEGTDDVRWRSLGGRHLSESFATLQVSFNICRAYHSCLGLETVCSTFVLNVWSFSSKRLCMFSFLLHQCLHMCQCSENMCNNVDNLTPKSIHCFQPVLIASDPVLGSKRAKSARTAGWRLHSCGEQSSVMFHFVRVTRTFRSCLTNVCVEELQRDARARINIQPKTKGSTHN